jgi:hypothetical protein
VQPILRLVALIPTRLQGVLGRLHGNFADKAEDAYRDRDAAGNLGGRMYAAGQAQAYGQAEETVRKAQAEADKPAL